MTRMDPLTQTMTVPNVSAPPRVTQAPDHATAPAEAVSRFVPAIDRGAETNTLEVTMPPCGCVLRMTGQMSGLSDLDTRLSGAAEGCAHREVAQALPRRKMRQRPPRPKPGWPNCAALPPP